MHLSETDRELAIESLLRLSPAALRGLIPERMRSMVGDVEGPLRREQPRMLAEFLLDLYGADLLGQPEVRKQLCLSIDGQALMLLREAAGIAGGSASRRAVATQVAERKWYAGKAWPRYFAGSMGFPLVFAGTEPALAPPPWEEVEGYQRPPDLHPYQKEACKLAHEVIRAPARRNRAVLSLPTGAGKTRAAVEVLVRSIAEGWLPRPSVLWVAQSDELCEQALAAFRLVWQAEGGPGVALRLYRLWGGGRDLADVGYDGVVIASIQKLYSMARHPESAQELKELGGALGALIIDEAHHATAPSYGAVLRALGIDTSPRVGSAVPILGLTATPGRGDTATQELSRLFYGNLLVPPSLDPDPIARLQELGILARAVHDVVPTGRRFHLTDAENAHFQTFAEFPDSFVRRIGADGERNKAIIDRLCRLDSTWPVLFFGCTVEHACAVAVLLRRRGLRSAVVTSHTSRAARQAALDDFKAGRLQVLCNYGILTTGFDAPGVRAVAVARPTASPVLYEQMIGRGMRGPKNGGTEECLIIDFSDNLERFGGQMAYTRFTDYWRPWRRTSSAPARGVTAFH